MCVSIEKKLGKKQTGSVGSVWFDEMHSIHFSTKWNYSNDLLVVAFGTRSAKCWTSIWFQQRLNDLDVCVWTRYSSDREIVRMRWNERHSSYCLKCVKKIPKAWQWHYSRSLTHVCVCECMWHFMSKFHRPKIIFDSHVIENLIDVILQWTIENRDKIVFLFVFISGTNL